MGNSKSDVIFQVEILKNDTSNDYHIQMFIIYNVYRTKSKGYHSQSDKFYMEKIE